MRNIFLFARREFLERVRTKAFIFTTIFFPVMMLGFTVVPTLLMYKGTSAKTVEVVTSTPTVAAAIKQNMEDISKADKNNTQFVVRTATATSDKDKDSFLSRITDNKSATDRLDGLLWATDDAVAGNRVFYYAATASDFKTNSDVERAVNRTLQTARLQAHGVPTSEVDGLLKRVDMEVHGVDRGKAKAAEGMASFFTPFILMFMMYLTMLIYGMAVMRSVLEEKTSKIFEVMLSTATATDLMAGKVLGVGAVGLVQIGIWAAAGLLSRVFFGATTGSILNFQPLQFVYFAIFFIIGYILYSSLFAAVGAMVNSEQEAQQLQTWVMLPLIACMVFLTKIISDPNGPIAFWASMFPLTSPLLMYVRIVIQQPPFLTQILPSIALAVATEIGLLWACARIYRVGILMYGKRPTLPEIVKWVKYA